MGDYHVRFREGFRGETPLYLLDCLLQPGLLLDQPLKSMRANSFQLIKFCGTRTDPAAETKSIGLQADAQLSWFLHASLTTLSWHDKSCPLIGTTPSGQFYRDKKLSSIYRDFAKTHANPDTDGNSSNRRAVMFHSIWVPYRPHLDNFIVTHYLRPFIQDSSSIKIFWLKLKYVPKCEYYLIDLISNTDLTLLNHI
jgi:hypothetical protein